MIFHHHQHHVRLVVIIIATGPTTSSPTTGVCLLTTMMMKVFVLNMLFQCIRSILYRTTSHPYPGGPRETATQNVWNLSGNFIIRNDLIGGNGTDDKPRIQQSHTPHSVLVIQKYIINVTLIFCNISRFLKFSNRYSFIMTKH